MAVGEASMLQQSLLTVAILFQCCGVESLCSHSEGESFEVSVTPGSRFGKWWEGGWCRVSLFTGLDYWTDLFCH